MEYRAKAGSTVEQKYYWKNPNNRYNIVYGLERHYPGWIATDMMTEKDGELVVIKAYEPNVVEPIPEPVELMVCKFKDVCPFYTAIGESK